MTKTKYLLLFSILLLPLTFISAQTEEVFSGLDGPDALFFTDDALFVAQYDGNEVSKLDLTSSPPTITTVATGISQPNGIFIDGDMLYISEANLNKISRVNLAGSSTVAVDFVTGVTRPAGLCVKDDFLYIAEYNADKISRVDITAANPIAVDFMTGLSTPSGMSLDGDNLYIAEFFGNNISKIDLSSSPSILTNVITGLDNPYEVAAKNSMLYIVEYYDGNVLSLNLDNPSEGLTNLVENLNNPDGIAVSNTDVYFSEYGNGKVSKLNLVAPLGLSISTVQPTCFGESGALTEVNITGGLEPYEVSISPDAPQDNIPAGEYIVTVEDASNMTISLPFLITEPDEIIINLESTIETGNDMNGTGTVLANGGTPPYNFLWSNNETSATVDNLVGGTYTVTVTDANGCAVVGELLVETLSSIANINNNDFLKVFPNPAEQRLFIENESERRLDNLTFYNLLGMKFTATVNTNDELIQLELPVELSSGVYLLQLEWMNGEKSVVRFLKK